MRIFSFVLLLITFQLAAQENNCGSNLRLTKYLESNEFANQQRVKLKKETKDFILSKSINTSIPVVVHVVYKNANENISDTQIHEQLNVLTEDFTRANLDALNTPTDFLPIVADMQITFCLAQRDPNGLPTNGIIRKQTANNFFPLYGDAISYDSLGGSTAWNTKKYLNIWVCEVENGILGWGQFPAGGDVNTDGVVIDFEHFGTSGTALYPYNLGRTTTHEVGHWFNLYHLWGDNNCGNDWVNDTPEQEQANYGCKTHPHQSCSNDGDMFMNFMDYTNDACMNSFTLGQKNRLWSTIYNYRIDLLTSNGCLPASIPNSDAGIISILNPNTQNINCANPIYPKVVLKNYGATTLNSVIIEYSIDGSSNYSYSWSGNLNPLETDTILLSGISSSGSNHLLVVKSSLPNATIDINQTNDEKTLIFSSINGVEINLNILTDNYANETSWELINDNNIIIDSDNNLSNNTFYQLSYCLDFGCYRFIINDSYGDGLCCNFGNGFYQISENFSATPYAFVNQFLFTDTAYFCVGSTSITEEYQSFNIYPNPTKGNLYINTNTQSINTPIFAKIFNNLGQEILNISSSNGTLNLSALKDGMYHIIIKTETKQVKRKIIIQK